MSWDDASQTLTIQPGGTGVSEFTYFLSGIPYIETSSITETIADEEGLWIIYLDSEGTMASIKNPTHNQLDNVIQNKCTVAYVYWDATNKDGRLMPDLHGYRMPDTTCVYLHNFIGSVYYAGMELENFVIGAGGLDTHAQFGVASGEFHDECIEFNLNAIPWGTGLEIWYLDGANWRWTTNPGFSILTTGSGRMAIAAFWKTTAGTRSSNT